MLENSLKRRLRAGDVAIGFSLTLPSPQLAQRLARVGYHWYFIDAEHAPLSIDQVALLCHGVRAGGGVPVVRVPWNGADHIQRALDAGAWGVVVPVVNTRAEAEAAVAAAKFPPRGFRSQGGSLHAESFGTDPATYYARGNDETVVIVMIETRTAVEHAAEILRVDGVDACLIGPNDLAASFGWPEARAMQEPAFQDAVSQVLRAAKAAGVAPGIACRDVASIHRRTQEGFQLMTIGGDVRLLVPAAEALASEVGVR